MESTEVIIRSSNSSKFIMNNLQSLVKIKKLLKFHIMFQMLNEEQGKKQKGN